MDAEAYGIKKIGGQMNGQKIQESFRWVTPITLSLLTALLSIFLFMLGGWKDELKEIKACASDFEKEVRKIYMPRIEIEGHLKYISETLTEIKNKP